MKIKILAAAIVAVACATVASAQTSPTMDGTASLTFMLGTLSAAGAR